jgi:hypothetical protein
MADVPWPAIPDAVYDMYTASTWVRQPDIEPSVLDINMFTVMANPPV